MELCSRGGRCLAAVLTVATAFSWGSLHTHGPAFHFILFESTLNSRPLELMHFHTYSCSDNYVVKLAVRATARRDYLLAA